MATVSNPQDKSSTKESSMSVINTEIKPFTAQAFKNGEFITVTDADVKGKWAVFFFYPADFTFVCPTELGDVADHYEELQKLGVEVYSVSTDTHFTHKAWHDSSETIGKIKYTMIGDPTMQISRNFEILREDQGLANRGTFIVDPQGIIQAVEITAEGIGRNAADLLRKVKAAQYVAAHPGVVCPAKWEEGEATLAPSLDLVGKILVSLKLGPLRRAAPGWRAGFLFFACPSWQAKEKKPSLSTLFQDTHTMLDANLKKQLDTYLQNIVKPIEISVSVDDSPKGKELYELASEIAEMSGKIS